MVGLHVVISNRTVFPASICTMQDTDTGHQKESWLILLECMSGEGAHFACFSLIQSKIHNDLYVRLENVFLHCYAFNHAKYIYKTICTVRWAQPTEVLSLVASSDQRWRVLTSSGGYATITEFLTRTKQGKQCYGYCLQVGGKLCC
jgi:hypothetical protein